MRASPNARRGSSPVARQILTLQVLVVLVVVVGAGALAWTDARRSQLDEARQDALAVARSVADNPLVRTQVVGEDPTTVLQPYAEQVRRDTGTDFVVVMSLDRTRYTHPDPARIGQSFIGDLGEAPAGGVLVQEFAGTLGPSVPAVVPVTSDGRVVALVSVGVTTARIQDALVGRLPVIALAALAVLAVGVTGAWLISRRLRRQTHGLGEAEITRMYEYYDAVLHAVREGLLLVDTTGRVQLVNHEARRLLALPTEVTGRRVEDLGLPPGLAAAIVLPERRDDEIHVADQSVLVLSSAPATWRDRVVGRVVTLRDHTELRAVVGELDAVRGLAESLRSQNHEAANRLHTVVSLVELGRTEEAVGFATEELAVAQALTDRVLEAVDDPVLSALLLGKTAQAAERGVTLRLVEGSRVDDLPFPARDVVTVVGNLLDNAFDAVTQAASCPAGAGARVVEVDLDADTHHLWLEVRDSGAGVPADLVDDVFRRGWSTKSVAGSSRGLGLALVVSTVRRVGGPVSVEPSVLGGAAFTVRVEVDP